MSRVYVSVFFLALIFLIRRFKNKKNKKAIDKPKTDTIPTYWHQLLESNVLFYEKLNTENQECFKKRVQFFYRMCILNL